jgi:hypothetical protein
MSAKTVLCLAGVACLLAACGEKPQTLGTRSDASPVSGPTGSAVSYSAPGWKAGDKTSWEQALRTRAQYGQNDHTRAP